MQAKKSVCLVAGLLLGLASVSGRAGDSISKASPSEKIIIDTDIGTDIDDAFAVALGLESPELQVLGFATASGDTTARAKILDQLLGVTGHADLPVAAGQPTTLPHGIPPIGRQGRFGEKGQFAKATHAEAVNFYLEQIHRFPGEITLVAIGPLTNLGALLDKDPDAFHRLKRIVIMGGLVGNANLGGWGTMTSPAPEYNIEGDIPAAQKVFRAGVSLYVMPLDSTIQLKMDEVKRDAFFAQATPLSDSLGTLYLLWGNQTPVLFDAMPVAFLIKPDLCPVEPMRIVVDDGGVTRREAGKPNVQVCLHSDPEAFFKFFMAHFQ
jgi:purine nucleosidase